MVPKYLSEEWYQMMSVKVKKEMRELLLDERLRRIKEKRKRDAYLWKKELGQ